MSTSLIEELASDTLLVGVPGPDLDASTARTLSRLRPAGVTLFGRNIVDEARLRALVAGLRDLLDEPLIAIDQEGGRVDRLRRIDGPSPPAREVARGGETAVRLQADATGRRLRALGINVNFAPVVDVDEGNEANGIGDRALGTDPDDVTRLAAVVIDSHRRAGVLACLKHFPGLGRTGADTHAVRPTVTAAESDLLGRELVPYKRLADVAPSVMVGHAAYPSVTGSSEPACFSPAMVEGLLRRRLSFDGLVFTDDLEMGAVRARAPGERAIRALAAGCDVLLYCERLAEAAEAREALVAAASSGRLSEQRLRDASFRSRSTRRRLALGDEASGGPAVRVES